MRGMPSAQAMVAKGRECGESSVARGEVLGLLQGGETMTKYRVVTTGLTWGTIEGIEYKEALARAKRLLDVDVWTVRIEEVENVIVKPKSKPELKPKSKPRPRKVG